MTSLISVTAAPADESVGSGFGGTLVYTVELSEASTDAVRVEYRVYPGSADIDIDVGTQTGTVVFAPGETTQTVSFRAASDALPEFDEAFVMEFFNPDGGSFASGTQTLRVTNFIEDDDGVGSDRALFVSNPVFVEGDAGTRDAVFTISLSEAFSTTTVMGYRTEDGSATAGSDYEAASGSIQFAPGQTELEVRVPVAGDMAAEPNETFRLIVDTNGTIADGGVGAVGEATIRDDDSGNGLPTLHFSVENTVESIGSGFGGLVTVTAYLSAPSEDAVSFSYRPFGDSALRGIDLPLPGNTVTFAPGETVAVDTFRVASDGVGEADESFVISFENPQGAVFAGNARVVQESAFILDDDGVGADRALHVSSPVVVEGDDGTTRAIFEVSLSRPATETLSFSYATRDAGAEAGSDYTATSGIVTFAPGQTGATVEVPVTGDTVSEMSESFQLVVTPAAGIADGGAGAVGDATILDDDSGGALPTLSLFSAPRDPQVVAESVGSGFGGTVSFNLVLSEPSTDAVTVQYRSIPLTAESEIDYPRPAVNEVVFAPGQTVVNVDLRVRSDNFDEDDEAFAFEFFGIQGAEFEGGAPVLRETAFILDDDGVGNDRSLQVSSPVLIEGDDGIQTARFEVMLSRPSSDTLEFAYATQDGTAEAGSDYTAVSGTLSFAPGQTFTVVDVPVAGDTATELSEFFQLAVTPTPALGDGGAGAVGQALVLDDDGPDGLPTITVGATNVRESVGSGFGGTVDFFVMLSEPAADTVTVEYRGVDRTTSGGSDLNAFTGMLTFAPGQTTATVSHRVLSDNVDEADESFAIELFDPVGAVLAGDVLVQQEAAFILDDDGVGLDRAIHVSDVELYEPLNGTATASFVITLSRPFASTTQIAYQTIDGTANAGSDYIAQSGTLTFVPGQTEAAVIVEIAADDVTTELTETFFLSLPSLPATITGGPEGSLGTATVRQQPNPPVPPTGAIVISGDTNVGATLQADVSGIADMNGLGPFTLQWFRDTEAVPGATGDSYVLGQADLYANITLVVSYTDGIGTEESLSADVGPVAPALPTDGPDSILGGEENDTISGGPGNDTLSGGGGDDVIAASDGADSVDGGDGDDLIGGGLNGDFILGGSGDDTIGAGMGDDTADGGNGADIVNGGAGNDSLMGGGGNDTMGASFGHDTVEGGDGNDDMGGGTGQDLINGGSGDDSAGGGEGDDTVNGGTGSDFLAGGGRDDVIDGGSGNDTVNGGDGDDTMTGGSGNDVFVWNFFKDGDADVITDFEDGFDLFRMVGVENAPGTGLQGKVDALGITDTAEGAQMTIGGHTILVEGVAAANLTLDDFVFL